MSYSAIILLTWNVVVMLIYGADKIIAKAHKRRISEFALLVCAFVMGGCGAMFGMVLFNHKTSKMKFRILVPFTVLLETIAIYMFGSYFGM